MVCLCSAGSLDPFATIGYSMVTLINLGTGLSHYEYAMSCQNGYVLSSALCTVYYMIYMATVVLLLLNLLTGRFGDRACWHQATVDVDV